MDRDERRRIAAAEAREIRDDPADLAEVRAIQDIMDALRSENLPDPDRNQ